MHTGERLKIIIVGASHRTAPVEVRERLAFSPHALSASLEQVKNLPHVQENLILSTCNRMEVLLVTNDVPAAMTEVKEFLAGYQSLEQEELEKYLYAHANRDAVKHLFRVAASLDSMVLGEAQILGQLKDAYRTAAHGHCCGLVLNRLLHKAFSVAKRVRTETSLGNYAVSVSYVAVELGKKIFGDLKEKSVLLLGAGEMAELAASNLLRAGVNELIVANRTFKRGQELAAKFQGIAIEFSQFSRYLQDVDIVLSSTGSMEFLIKKDKMAKVIKARKNRPLFLIDIAVPRDIDPTVNEIDNVYLYDIDDLQSVADANLSQRKQEAGRAEEIVEEETNQFLIWLDGLLATPTIVSLIHTIRGIKEAEVKKALARLKQNNPEDKKAVEALARAIVNKVLHRPITRLKKSAGSAEGLALVDAARKLFDLDGE